MANEEQLSILKQGVEVWNKWREKNLEIHIDFVGANLKGINLQGANFQEVSLTGAILKEADLRGAYLRKANFGKANLRKADLKEANLVAADFQKADLEEANLLSAHLIGANFKEANLKGVDFTGADLRYNNFCEADLIGANFNEARLKGSNFSKAWVGGTIFGYSKLSEAIGLDSVLHYRPSSISIATLARSEGTIPEVFLRGCGLSDWEIEQVRLYNPNLSNDEVNKILYKIYDLRAGQAIQISPLFISYSHGDNTFVDKIENQLNKKGIRFWRDIHDMKSGRLEKQIDRAIRQNSTVLLVLSEHSLKSDWVEHEVRTARGLAKDTGHDILCPIALDDSWKNSRWPKRILEQIMEYNILDFSGWEDDVKFDGMFRRLIDGLELFYKG